MLAANKNFSLWYKKCTILSFKHVLNKLKTRRFYLQTKIPIDLTKGWLTVRLFIFDMLIFERSFSFFVYFCSCAIHRNTCNLHAFSQYFARFIVDFIQISTNAISYDVLNLSTKYLIVNILTLSWLYKRNKSTMPCTRHAIEVN